MATKTVTFQAKDKSAKKVDSAMQEIHESSNPNQVAMAAGVDGTNDRTLPGRTTSQTLEQTALRQPGAVDEQFPTTALTKKDARDVMMTDKLALADEEGITPFGQLIATDEDFAWLRGKREKEEEANFQQWFALNYDHMNPEGKAIARDLWPDFYAQRDQTLDETVELQRRIAKMKLHGIRTVKDLFLQYAIESGYIQADPLEHVIHPEKAAAAKNRATRQERYGRGLFNPRRLPTKSDGIQTRAENAQMIMQRGAGDSTLAPAFAGTEYKGIRRGFASPHLKSRSDSTNGKGGREFENSNVWDREKWLTADNLNFAL